MPQGCGVGYVSYTVTRNMYLNPDVMVSRAYRSTPVGSGKWELQSTGKGEWVRNHERKYPHVDHDYTKTSVFDALSPTFWSRRAEVRANPEHFTRSGRERLAE